MSSLVVDKGDSFDLSMSQYIEDELDKLTEEALEENTVYLSAVLPKESAQTGGS